MATLAPGISLKTLLLGAKPKAVQDLFSPSTIELIKRMSPGILGTKEINRIAAVILDPAESLLNSSTRLKIVRLLPLAKARELCTILGLKSARSPYDLIVAEIGDASIDRVNREFW